VQRGGDGVSHHLERGSACWYDWQVFAHMLKLILGLVAIEERFGELTEANSAILLGEIDLDASDSLLDDAQLVQRCFVVVVDPLRL